MFKVKIEKPHPVERCEANQRGCHTGSSSDCVRAVESGARRSPNVMWLAHGGKMGGQSKGVVRLKPSRLSARPPTMMRHAAVAVKGMG